MRRKSCTAARRLNSAKLALDRRRSVRQRAAGAVCACANYQEMEVAAAERRVTSAGVNSSDIWRTCCSGRFLNTTDSSISTAHRCGNTFSWPWRSLGLPSTMVDWTPIRNCAIQDCIDRPIAQQPETSSPGWSVSRGSRRPLQFAIPNRFVTDVRTMLSFGLHNCSRKR